ncbi:MAG: HAD family phosphatase [Christensenellaceae bacterium]|nr:HAD family phosphatase [Christensenellaceae bacterium]
MRLLLNDRCSVMPWDAIDNVVFDVGNVLLAFQPEAILRKLLPEHESSYPALTRCIFQSPYWAMMDRGAINGEEAAAMMSCREPSLRPLIETVMRGWNDCLDVMDEGVEALEACIAHGKHCYALTNYADLPFADSCRKHPGIFTLFDGMAVSGRLHIIKPDPRIYRRLIDEYHLDPERTLFIDDSAANAEGALECGLQALHYHTPGMLRAFFR